MKKFNQSQMTALERSALSKVCGGHNVCYECTGCEGAASAMSKNQAKYNSTTHPPTDEEELVP
jgi:hypothetical protein